MLSTFTFTDLYEERAILLSKIGQHEQALNIYAHKLNDEKMAEDYCAKHYNPDNEKSRDIYLALLRTYLHPPDDIKPAIDAALSLLNKHYKHIDTPKALELLPSNTPVNKLYPFLESVLRDKDQTQRHNQVVKNLLKAENLQIRERLIKGRSRMLRITEDRMCPVCNKRLGASVFAVYPNNIVVHYMCCKDKSVCPVTGINFAAAANVDD